MFLYEIHVIIRLFHEFIVLSIEILTTIHHSIMNLWPMLYNTVDHIIYISEKVIEQIYHIDALESLDYIKDGSMKTYLETMKQQLLFISPI